MPVFEAQFEVTRIYNIYIEAEDYDAAKIASWYVDYNDIEVSGEEEPFSIEHEFRWMSKTPVEKSGIDILDSEELSARPE